MTDADKLERIRSIVADHDAYGLTRHHEMVLDITDVLAEKSGAPPGAEPPWQRHYYLCETLDEQGDSAAGPVVSDVTGPVAKEEANLVGSLCTDSVHRPVIDIDHPCQLVPSTTEGHFHLYIDVPMETPVYMKLLDAMVDAGIVQPFFAEAAKVRRGTFCRPPWVKKVKPEPQEAKP